MDRRQLLSGMAALGLARGFDLDGLLRAQDIETAGWQANTGNSGIPGRQHAGLRGPVKSCVEGTTTTEYDQEGRLLAFRNIKEDGSVWCDAYVYDSSGHVLKIISRKWDGTTGEQVYSYDEMGRLLGIADSSGDQTDFHYDEQGRKTSVQRFASRNTEGALKAVASAGSVFEAAQLRGGDGVPRGGSLVTLYNERDQPTELQTRDDKGHDCEPRGPHLWH